MPSDAKNIQSNETLLAIDYGETNIGLAFGRSGFTQPLHTIPGKNKYEAIKEISRLTLENKVDKIIIGLPLTAENKETKKSQQVRQFVKELKIYLKKPVVFVNEYLTSQNALESALNQGISQKNRRSLDHVAAALILKKYYEEQGK